MISGIELDEQQARITVHDVPDRPGHAARIFRKIADADIVVDMIVQNVSTMGSPNLSFTVRRQDVDRAAEAAVAVVGASGVSVEPQMAKLSLEGVGMRSHTGVAMRMFGALADRRINPVLINTSEVRINVAVDLAHGREARSSSARRRFSSRCPAPDLIAEEIRALPRGDGHDLKASVSSAADDGSFIEERNLE